MKRILLYSHDTVGLGNISRTLAIANRLVEGRDDITVLILSGSPMLHAFRISKGIDYVKLPCLDRSHADGYRVKTLGVGLKDLLRLRANLILNVMLDFSPDLVLIDKKPLGVSRELAPAFELMNLRGMKPKCVLVLRDILDHPDQTTRIWQEQRYYEAVDVFYDQILVLGSPEVFNLPDEYRFPAQVKSKVKFCGYLERPPGLRTPEQVRKQLGLSNKPLVLVTAGGGGDGDSLVSHYLQSLMLNDRSHEFESLVICGPEMSPKMRAEISRMAEHLPTCHIGEFSNDMMSEMAAADLIVSMGGYNTFCEILSLKKRAIIVPRHQPVQEQLMRTERMAALGLVQMIHPEHLNPGRMMQAVLAGLEQKENTFIDNSTLNLQGLENVANAVDELLSADVLNFTLNSGVGELALMETVN